MSTAARSPALGASVAIAASLVLLTGCDSLLRVSTGSQSVPPAALDGDLRGATIVDVRPVDDYAAGHIPESVSVPPSALHAFFRVRASAPPQPVVLVGETEAAASLALPSARAEGVDSAFVLDGGMRRWRDEHRAVVPGAPRPIEEQPSPPARALSVFQQGVSLASGTLIKPTYMLLALALAWALRRSREPALKLLFHGCLWFFIGEAFCAVDYYFHGSGHLHAFDLLHGAGMVVMSALVPWGLVKLFDDRVVHFTDSSKPCAMQRLCGHCWKRESVRCGPRDVMIPLAASGAVLSLLPWSLDILPTSFRAPVFGFDTDYGSPIINQLLELRLYPSIGAALFAATAVQLLFSGPRSWRRIELTFFAAVGFSAFALFRQLLFGTWRDALYWADFWEETTELIAVLAVGAILVVFRRQLGLLSRSAAKGA